MGDVRVSPDWDAVGDEAVLREVLRARRSLSKPRIEESNSVCASWEGVSLIGRRRRGVSDFGFPNRFFQRVSHSFYSFFIHKIKQTSRLLICGSKCRFHHC